MDEAHPVGRVNPFAGLHHQAEHRFQRQGGSGLLKGLPSDELHGDVGLAAPLADLVHPAHVRMLHPGLELGFLDEPLEDVRIVAPQELQGHHAAKAGVRGLEDAPHAPFAEQHEGFEPAPAVQRLCPEDAALPEPCGWKGSPRGWPGRSCRRPGLRGRRVPTEGRLGRDLHGPVARLCGLHIGQILGEFPAVAFLQAPRGDQIIEAGPEGLVGFDAPAGHRQGQHALVNCRHGGPVARSHS